MTYWNLFRDGVSFLIFYLRCATMTNISIRLLSYFMDTFRASKMDKLNYEQFGQKRTKLQKICIKCEVREKIETQ